MSGMDIGNLNSIYTSKEQNLRLKNRTGSDGESLPPIDPTEGPEDDLTIYERLLKPTFEKYYKNLMSLPSKTTTIGVEYMTRYLYPTKDGTPIKIYTDASVEDRMVITITGHEPDKELVKKIDFDSGVLNIVYEENEI